MIYIMVTGRVSGREYLVPTENISTIEAVEGGSDIYLKRDGVKIKRIECRESLREIRKELNLMQ